MKVKELITKLLDYDLEKEIRIQDGCMLEEIRQSDISEKDNKIIIQK